VLLHDATKVQHLLCVLEPRANKRVIQKDTSWRCTPSQDCPVFYGVTPPKARELLGSQGCAKFTRQKQLHTASCNGNRRKLQQQRPQPTQQKLHLQPRPLPLPRLLSPRAMKMMAMTGMMRFTMTVLHGARGLESVCTQGVLVRHLHSADLKHGYMRNLTICLSGSSSYHIHLCHIVKKENTEYEI
jgi:hypothetical protein